MNYLRATLSFKLFAQDYCEPKHPLVMSCKSRFDTSTDRESSWKECFKLDNNMTIVVLPWELPSVVLIMKPSKLQRFYQRKKS